MSINKFQKNIKIPTTKILTTISSFPLWRFFFFVHSTRFTDFLWIEKFPLNEPNPLIDYVTLVTVYIYFLLVRSQFLLLFLFDKTNHYFVYTV